MGKSWEPFHHRSRKAGCFSLASALSSGVSSQETVGQGVAPFGRSITMSLFSFGLGSAA